MGKDSEEDEDLKDDSVGDSKTNEDEAFKDDADEDSKKDDDASKDVRGGDSKKDEYEALKDADQDFLGGLSAGNCKLEAYVNCSKCGKWAF